MSWLFSKFYDPVMAATEEACLGEWRKALLSPLRGEILEIGGGTGVNFPFYDPAANIVSTEPDTNMYRILQEKAQNLPHILTIQASAMELPFEAASFDHIVTTLVLCTVPDLQRTLAELRRVLKPGGSLIFIEHVAAEEGSSRRTWQHRLDPIWQVVAEGCHLCRDTETALAEAGFEIQSIDRESMRKAIPLVRPCIRGIALLPCEEVSGE